MLSVFLTFLGFKDTFKTLQNDHPRDPKQKVYAQPPPGNFRILFVHEKLSQGFESTTSLSAFRLDQGFGTKLITYRGFYCITKKFRKWTKFEFFRFTLLFGFKNSMYRSQRLF